MAGPITWRSLITTQLSDAARPLQAATGTFDGAFAQLGRVLENQQAVNQGAQDRGDEAKVLAFREALAGAQTPEQVAAIQAQRDQMLGGVATKFRSQVVGAEEARTSAVMDQIGKRAKFAEDQTLRDQRPIREAALAAAAKGDKATFDRIVAENPNLMGMDALVQAAVKGGREAATFSEQQAQWGHNADMRPYQLQAQENTVNEQNHRLAVLPEQLRLEQLAKQAGIDRDRAATRASQAATTASQSQVTLNNILKIEKAAGDVADKINSKLADNPTSDASRKTVDAWLGGVKDLKLQNAYRAAFGDAVNDPANAGMTTNQIINAINGAKDTSWLYGTDPSIGSAVRENLRKIRESAGFADQRKNRDAEIDRLRSVQAGYDVLLGSINSSSSGMGKPGTSPAGGREPAGQGSTSNAAAPAGAHSPAPAKGDSAKTVDVALLRRQAEVEQQLYRMGDLKELSPEVQDYLRGTLGGEGKRMSAKELGEMTLRSFANFGNAASDILTIPLHGVGNLANTVIRVPNSFGANIPNIPDVGGRLTSLTPYTDAQLVRDSGVYVAEDLKKELATLRGEAAKKAR
jgi:hypothetical protein